jgi:GTP-binding protein
VLKLPVGTLVFDDGTGALIVDLDEEGKSYVIARGGRGGFGNEHFKSPTNQTPRSCTPGAPAEELTIRMELKLVADVGIVGKPNAGKSTLISSVSRAHPKIADYPFTTLEPNLGIAELAGYRRVVLADIPGLIEGAHAGAGLGHRFLRHIERTRVLLHLVEVEPADGTDPVENYRVILAELAAYSELLAAKPMVVGLSKMDLLPGGREEWPAAVQLFEQALGVPVYPISAASREGLTELMEACWRKLDKPRSGAAWIADGAGGAGGVESRGKELP